MSGVWQRRKDDYKNYDVTCGVWQRNGWLQKVQCNVWVWQRGKDDYKKCNVMCGSDREERMTSPVKTSAAYARKKPANYTNTNWSSNTGSHLPKGILSRSWSLRKFWSTIHLVTFSVSSATGIMTLLEVTPDGTVPICSTSKPTQKKTWLKSSLRPFSASRLIKTCTALYA